MAHTEHFGRRLQGEDSACPWQRDPEAFRAKRRDLRLRHSQHLGRIGLRELPRFKHLGLAGFSVERLMNLLTALDQDVEIVIRRKPRSRKTGRISVVAA